jgi:1-phosphofructokinase
MPTPQDVHPDQVRVLDADPTLTLSGAAA